MLAHLVAIETLENRRFLTVSPVYAPHAVVKGESLGEWSADWWKTVFAIPVYGKDNKTIVNPQFDAPLKDGDVVAPARGVYSRDGRVFFLFGTFFGGEITRNVTVPSDTPIFIPLVNTEWSNPDTATGPKFDQLPGDYSIKQLKAFAKAQADSISDVRASLDGKKIKHLFQHRESAVFRYRLPAENSIIKTFFGLDIKGPVPSAADGYYLMFKPLSVGKHTIKVGGASPDNTGTPPLLGPFDGNTTYNITVLPKHKFKEHFPAPAAKAIASVFNTVKRILDDVL